MIRKIKSYIFFHYLKYLLIFTLIFICIIWLSQVLRILDLKFSISSQLINVITTSALALPSFINIILPIILLISSYYLNFVFNSNNENLIIQQYLNKNHKISLRIIILTIIFILYFFNGEFVSPKLYKIYKEKEIDIRNSIKLGIPKKNEFHIDNKLSIFFDKNKNNFFYDVESLIYVQGQFIKSEQAMIEYDKYGFNIIFFNGFRIKMNNLEQSKTIFEKFTFHLKNEDLDELTYDKEHFNTFDLLKSNNRDYFHYGHNKIYNYIFLIILLITSFKISITKNLKRNNFDLILLFIIVITSLILNSYLLHILNKNIINLYIFYIVNFLMLSFIYLFASKLNEHK